MLTDIQELIELRCARSAFPAEYEEARNEERDAEFFDALEDDEDYAPDVDTAEIEARELEMLEELPLPG